jgi:hypothetical protein
VEEVEEDERIVGHVVRRTVREPSGAQSRLLEFVLGPPEEGYLLRLAGVADMEISGAQAAGRLAHDCRAPPHGA